MQKQRGMTFIGTVLTIAAIVFVATVIMRVVPVYIKYYAIRESIKSLGSMPISSLSGDPELDISVFRVSLMKRLNINGIEDLHDNNIVFSPNGPNKYNVLLRYQEVRPLWYNVSLLFDFNDTIEVVAGSES